MKMPGTAGDICNPSPREVETEGHSLSSFIGELRFSKRLVWKERNGISEPTTYTFGCPLVYTCIGMYIACTHIWMNTNTHACIFTHGHSHLHVLLCTLVHTHGCQYFHCLIVIKIKWSITSFISQSISHMNFETFCASGKFSGAHEISLNVTCFFWVYIFPRNIAGKWENSIYRLEVCRNSKG